MNAGTTWLPTKPLAPVTRILDTACSPYVIAQGSTFPSGEHPLLNPVAQLVHICLRPRPVAGHRALPKSPEDRRGVRLDISVAPEVEPPLHRPTIGFPKQRPYVSLETQRHSVPPSDTISRARSWVRNTGFACEPGRKPSWIRPAPAGRIGKVAGRSAKSKTLS